MKPKRLTKLQVELVLDYLDRGVEKSIEIAQELNIGKMQVAGVKAWRTMNHY